MAALLNCMSLRLLHMYVHINDNYVYVHSLDRAGFACLVLVEAIFSWLDVLAVYPPLALSQLLLLKLANLARLWVFVLDFLCREPHEISGMCFFCGTVSLVRGMLAVKSGCSNILQFLSVAARQHSLMYVMTTDGCTCIRMYKYLYFIFIFCINSSASVSVLQPNL